VRLWTPNFIRMLGTEILGTGILGCGLTLLESDHGRDLTLGLYFGPLTLWSRVHPRTEGLEPIRESQNTQSMELRFRAHLAEETRVELMVSGA
jgi:hypothetical protein